MKTRYTLIAVFLFFITGQSVFAQTNVSGLISSNTTWTLANSPFIVTGNIIVNNGVTLTIQPGVAVKFNSGLSMQIDGELVAQGTSSDSIVFTSNTLDSAGAWGYIYFSGTSVPASYQGNIYGNYVSGSILEYCKIQYAGGANVSYNGALRLNGAHPFVNYCTITNNSSTGIHAYNLTGMLKISNSVISNNNNTGAGGGIYIYSSGNNLIYANTVSDNTASDGGGIFIAYGGNANTIISDNIISNNTAILVGGGISCGDGAYISNNIIMNNSTLYDGGGGIGITAYIYSNITDNIIINNTSGSNGGGINDGSRSNSSNNVIADNTSNNLGGGLFNAYGGAILNNHIVRNTSVDGAGIYWWSGGSQDIKLNAIVNNKNTNLNNTKNTSLYILSNPNINSNNIFNNSVFYELYNSNAQGTTNLAATNNWWGTTSNAAIQGKIYDWTDNNTLGIVNYSPYLTKPDTAAPVSVPFNVTKTDIGGGQVEVKWNQNPESDVAGYHIYYGNFTGYSFDNMIDVVGKADTSYTLTGVPVGDTIAVTAYDLVYNPASENAASITNDNMTNGNESWFTYAVGKPSPAFSATPVSVCPGDTVYYTANTGNVYPYANTSWKWTFTGGVPTSSNLQNPKVVYNTPGNYDAKLKVTNIAGSDSLTHVSYITVKSPTSATITKHLCNVSTYNSPSGLYIWSSNGTYHDTIPNHAGCDSILTFHLTFNSDSYNSISPESCDSYTSPSGNHIWTSSGIYYDTIPNTGGCDSIFTIYLTVYSIDASMTQTGSVLTANTTGASYQWLDCGNGYSIITDETNQSFTPLVNGDYAVQITENICVDTSSCYHVVISGIDNFGNDNLSELFPNPASDYVELKFNNAGNEDMQLNIYNTLGAVVRSEVIKQKQQKINISDLCDGVYVITIKSKDLTKNQKLIIQR